MEFKFQVGDRVEVLEVPNRLKKYFLEGQRLIIKSFRFKDHDKENFGCPIYFFVGDVQFGLTEIYLSLIRGQDRQLSLI